MNIYKKRRSNLIKESKAKLIIISANKPMQSSLDQSYDFVQENNFYYLTGLNIPGLTLIITNKESIIITPKLSNYQKIFDGEINISEIKTSKVDKIFDFEAGEEMLYKLISKNNKIHLLFDETEKLESYGIVALPFRKVLINKASQINPNAELINLHPYIAQMRMIKDESEIEIIREAVRITKQAIKKISNEKILAKINNTSELADRLLLEMKRLGAEGWAFRPVISLNKASTVIHYVDLNQEIKMGDLILVDVGCKYKNYCADISRSFVFGDSNERQIKLLDSVLKVQKQLINEIKVGMNYEELEARTEDLIFAELVDLGLLKGSEKDLLRDYYPHSVSHHLGLDTHDLSNYKTPLKENMIITVEPGIYVKKWGLGVRFEDDILITSKGAEVL